MKCWYFLFEGKFSSEFAEPDLRGKHFISSAMVANSNESASRAALDKELEKYDVALVRIEGKFHFDPDEIDRNDEENTGWISIYEETVRCDGVILTPSQVYDE